jgi:hypothetical protein
VADAPLFKRPPPYVGDKPFSEDLFEREAVADRLTTYIDRLSDGCVIGIDANWGDGKSWFGRNWHAKLAETHQTVFLDAFESDFVDDPFLIIAAELTELAKRCADEPTKVALMDRARAIGKRILPLAAKTATGVATRVLIGTEAADSVIDTFKGVPEDISKAAEKYVEKRLEELALGRKSIEAFRDTLTEFASQSKRPVVFFIDELDRCRPSFAVQLIERIKHFFDVPNLIFVLLINRTQLEAAIQGVYGPIAAGAYLSKFVHFFLTLPKKIHADQGSSNYHYLYLRKLLTRYGYADLQKAEYFVDPMSFFARRMDLSFRDLERSFIYYGMDKFNESAPVAAYLISLKLKKPDLFAELARGTRLGHEEAQTYLGQIIANEAAYWLGPVLHTLHTVHLTPGNLNEGQQSTLEPFRRLSINLGGFERIIPWVIRKLDVQLAN